METSKHYPLKRFQFLLDFFKRSVWIHPMRVAGHPCLLGHRITIAQIVAEVGHGNSIEQLAKDYGLPEESKDKIADLFYGIAGLIDMDKELFPVLVAAFWAAFKDVHAPVDTLSEEHWVLGEEIADWLNTKRV